MFEKKIIKRSGGGGAPIADAADRDHQCDATA